VHEDVDSLVIQLFNTTTAVLPIHEQDAETLLHLVADQTGVAFESVELVFVDAESIVDINQRFLQRDFVTDIISFRLDEQDDQAIEGILYCCVSRLLEQAVEYQVSERHEFGRIVLHGLLHLAGYNDTSVEEKATMTQLEDQLLTRWYAVV